LPDASIAELTGCAAGRRAFDRKETALLETLLVVAAALAAHQDPPVIIEGVKKDEEKTVCRSFRETGSRMVKQVCKTASKQKQDEQDARNKLGLGNRSTSPPETFKAPTGQ
jgi:hypothetical protein